MAVSLRECYDTPGFKLYSDQLNRELRRAELSVLAGVRDNLPNADVKYRQGFLDCLTRMIEVQEEMAQALEEGRIPWIPGRNSL